jgi:hypothetical protein
VTGQPNQTEAWPHPLLPWFTGIAVNSKPLVAFAPLEEIQREIDQATLIHPPLGEDEAKRQILTTYRHAAAALFAIAANGGSELDGTELHALLFVAAQAHPLAQAFCDAAGYALRLSLLPQFAVASRLPGFTEALKDWANHFEYEVPFSTPEQLKFIHREMVQNDKPAAQFWLRMCEQGFSSPDHYKQAMNAERRLYKDTLRKKPPPKRRNSRKKTPQREPARFKGAIAFGWLPASLWARTHRGTFFFFEPSGDDREAGENRVKGDVWDLGFTGSHHGDLERFIDAAGIRE